MMTRPFVLPMRVPILKGQSSMQIQRAISIRQPFVELILRGVKQEEYRSKPTHIRERVYLYASLQPFESDEEWKKVGCAPGELAVGLILGSVEIVDCRPDPIGDGYAYVLCNPVRFARALKPLNQPQPVFWRPSFTPAASTTPGNPGASEGVQKRTPTGKKAPEPMLQPDAALAAIVGAEPLSREDLIGRLWAYIKTNDLQDQREKRLVNADTKLRRLFGKNQVSMFEMASMIGAHVR